MNNRLYAITRDLHLYLGLFLAPFVLVFSVSVFFLVHAWTPGAKGGAERHWTVENVQLPAALDTLAGRARVDALRGVLAQAGVTGEVGFVGHNVKAQRLTIPVMAPGRETVVKIDLAARRAEITERQTGVWDALVALHKAPGPHLVEIRRNWLPMRVWSWFADGTVYLLLFLSLSGIYLWAVLRAERRIGLVLLGAGLMTFLGVAYAVIS
ncbi:MAG: PepSY-associated TM helix domain-containing protein [Acidobacteria bacterium]|nr:PepSY-associated TM helix domain-containing protein [Acidobacteriota bacterium]